MIYLPSYKVQVHRTEHSQEHSVDPDTVVFCNGLIQIYSAGFVKNKELGKLQKSSSTRGPTTQLELGGGGD